MQHNEEGFKSAILWFKDYFQDNFTKIIHEAIPYLSEPDDLIDLRQRIERLVKNVTGPWSLTDRYGVSPDETPPELLPVLKRIVLLWRRVETARNEKWKEATVNPGVLEGFDRKIDALDEMLDDPAFQSVEAIKLPRLLDYLSIQQIESIPQFQYDQTERREERKYDEKFHILKPPDLFPRDLAYYRKRCELRSVPLSIAFIDIDNFKRLNTELGHDVVDRYVLPYFMRALEAHVYNHGNAYRFGGDEYMMLLPNFSFDLGLSYLDEFRRRVGEQLYQVPARTTVSIGVCVIEEDCPLTDKELRERAGKAMAFAKDNGRNQIASYWGNNYRNEDLRIACGEFSEVV